MPAKGKKGEFASLPSTLEHAEETYHGDEARAHRTAWAAVKHSFEKVGDHWESKDHADPADREAREKK